MNVHILLSLLASTHTLRRLRVVASTVGRRVRVKGSRRSCPVEAERLHQDCPVPIWRAKQVGRCVWVEV